MLNVGGHATNHNNEWIFNPVFAGKPFDPKDITRVNETKWPRKVHNSAQLNKLKQLNLMQ